jgi:ABC-type glycerol-3-phosphate transport system permease component
VTLIPQYLIFTKVFHWTNTWFPQIVPAFFAAPWAVFLLRQFMMTIPVEVDEAARLDGCNDLQLFWYIILPMCKAGLGAIAIFTFTYVWNDLFTPLLYIRNADLGNMATGMSALGTQLSLFGERFPRDELTMAAAVIVSLPLVIVFFVFQKQYIQGVVITGVK